MNQIMNIFGPQAGEESWASLKCGGGPHREEFRMGSPVFKTLPASVGNVVLGAAISYDGTETGLAHATPVIQHEVDADRLDLPA